MRLLTVHEIGHMFGCAHHRDMVIEDDYFWDPDDYNYGYANCDPGRCWQTIMTYDNFCWTGNGRTCSYRDLEWIPYFSNPNVNYNGDPTGAADSDNARLINEGRIGASMNRHRNQRSLSLYKWRWDLGGSNDEEYLFFDIIGKKDITLNNFDLYLNETRQIEVFISRGSAPNHYDGKEFDESYWTLVASEVVTPLNATSVKLAPMNTLSNPLGIDIAAGETVSVRFKCIGSGLSYFHVYDSYGSIGDVLAENDDIALTIGQTAHDWDEAILYTQVVYETESTPPADPEPSSKPSFVPTSKPSPSPSNCPSETESPCKETSKSKFIFNLQQLSVVNGVTKIDWGVNDSFKSCSQLKKLGDTRPQKKEKICKDKTLVNGAWNACDITCGNCKNDQMMGRETFTIILYTQKHGLNTLF